MYIHGIEYNMNRAVSISCCKGTMYLDKEHRRLHVRVWFEIAFDDYDQVFYGGEWVPRQKVKRVEYIRAIEPFSEIDKERFQFKNEREYSNSVVGGMLLALKYDRDNAVNEMKRC